MWSSLGLAVGEPEIESIGDKSLDETPLDFEPSRLKNAPAKNRQTSDEAGQQIPRHSRYLEIPRGAIYNKSALVVSIPTRKNEWDSEIDMMILAGALKGMNDMSKSDWIKYFSD